jgi:hypothetical protein
MILFWAKCGSWFVRDEFVDSKMLVRRLSRLSRVGSLGLYMEG